MNQYSEIKEYKDEKKTQDNCHKEKAEKRKVNILNFYLNY
jgi:hypothetical protein